MNITLMHIITVRTYLLGSHKASFKRVTDSRSFIGFHGSPSEMALIRLVMHCIIDAYMKIILMLCTTVHRLQLKVKTGKHVHGLFTIAMH